MNFVVDAIIVLFILMCGTIGFKEGVIKRLSTVVGLILVVVIAFHFKSKVSFYLYENLPFFTFWGIFKGIQSLNIIFYEMLAFVIIASVLMIVYNIILGISGLIEKTLKATVILSIPSKILGFIVGLIETYINVFAILFFAKQPIFNQEVFEDSKLTPVIVNSSPGLSNIVSNMNESLKDIFIITKDYEDNHDKNSTNKQIIDSLLKHKVIDKDCVDKLVKKGKIKY